MQEYNTTKENLKSTIEKYGIAIIPNILTDYEIDDFRIGARQYFEYISQKWENQLNIYDIVDIDSFYDLFPSHGMLFQHWKIGHAQFVWDLRQNKKIIDIFSEFWKCKHDELLVSFDGISFNPPPELTKRSWMRKPWLHTDQSYTRNDFECIQSWITAFDVHEDDATLMVLEKSHLYHKEFASTFKITDKKDWHKLKDEEIQFYIDKGCSLKRISCPAGSIVFWDSRVIHCGANAIKTRRHQNYRLVVYLCYMPRNTANEKQLEKKRKAFRDMRMTSHWPATIKLFPKNPRTYGKKLPLITNIYPPKLSDLGLKLAGF